MHRRTFTPEFRQECVTLVIHHHHTVKDAASRIGIGFSPLQRWLRQYRSEISDVTPQACAITPEQRRKKQVRLLKSDNDLLKKAAIFFALEMSNTRK